MRSGTAACGFLAVGALVACANVTGLDFDPDAYEPIPPLHALDYTAVLPAADWDYWELRWAGITEQDSVLGAGGALSRDELEPSVREALDAVSPPTGFAPGCLPAYCYRYVVAAEGDAITVVGTRAGLAEFLAPVNTAEEAILLGTAGADLWWDEGENTGVRDLGGRWDLVLFELARSCMPVQTDHVRLRVHGDGSVTEEAREVWERHDGMCV